MVESHRGEGGAASGNTKAAGKEPAHACAVKTRGQSSDKESAKGDGAGVNGHSGFLAFSGLAAIALVCDRRLVDFDRCGASFTGDFQEDGPTTDEDHEGDDNPDPRAFFQEFDHGLWSVVLNSKRANR